LYNNIVNCLIIYKLFNKLFNCSTIWSVRPSWNDETSLSIQDGPKNRTILLQGGHIEHLMQKLQNVTVTLGSNWDNKHVVSCC